MASDQLTAVFNAVETVSEALDDINRSINEQQRELTQLNSDYLENTATTQVAEESQASLAREINDVSRAFGEAQRAMGMYNALSQTVAAANAELSSTAQLLQGRMDEVGDETSQATRRLALYNAAAESTAISMGALSVNVGAFTIALRDLGTQIPILVTTLGSLAAVAGGVAGALTMLAGAISFFAIGGAIAMWEDMESQFGDTEEAAEALEGVMRALLDLFMAAFEPLANQENAEFLITMVDWVAKLTNRFAQFFNQVRPMIMDFLSNVSEATDDIDNMFTAMAQGWRIVQPALEDLFVWLNNRLPGAIIFMSQTVEELREPLGRMTDIVIELTTSLVDMAGGAFPALITVLGLLMSVITALADLFNFLGDGLTEIIFTFAAMAFAGNKVLGSLNALVKPLNLVAFSIGNIKRAAFSGGAIAALRQLRAEIVWILGQKYQNLAGIASNFTLLRDSMISVLPAATRMNNGLLAIKGTQGFVDPKDVTTLGLLKTQFNATSTAALNYARRAVAAAIAATRSLATRFGLAALSGLQFFTALHTALIPGMLRTGATSNLLSASLTNLRRAFAGVKTGAIGAMSSMYAYATSVSLTNVAMGIFNTLTGGILPILGGILAVGAGVVGVIGNMHATISLANAAWGGFKSLIETVGNALLTVFIPAWNLLVEVLAVFVNLIMFVPRILNSIAQRLGLVGEGGSLLAKVFGTVVDVLTWAIERLAQFLEMLEDAVGRFNELLGGGDTLTGAKVTETGVRENLARDREEADERVQTEPDINLSFEDSLEQNIDVQADPEDQAQLSRVTKDAIEEANSFARRQQGGQ